MAIRQVFRGETLFIENYITEMMRARPGRDESEAYRSAKRIIPLAYVLLTRSKLSYRRNYARDQFLKRNSVGRGGLESKEFYL